MPSPFVLAAIAATTSRSALMRAMGALLAACAVAAMSPVPAVAEAAPGSLEGNIGLVGPSFRGDTPIGVEGELGLEGSPLHVGGVMWSPIFGSGMAETLWAGYAFTPWGGDRVMLMAGGTHYQQSGVGCVDVCQAPSSGGIFVGVSYLIREERLWLKLTPQYLFPMDGWSAYPQWALSGVPWVELGVPITPHCDISLRLGETILKVAYRL